MKENFDVLMDFMGRMGPEVVGHEKKEPDQEAVQLINRFAAGGCSETERAEVCRMLRVHPLWLHWLAAQVRINRAPQETAHPA
ncbi:MAG: hypothetical protein ABI680_10920 [Chthoniobacteraceae bacterium]